MNEQEMIKRYIYEVVKRIPQASREEIRLELQALIEDMCTEEHLTAEETLQKLGSPEEFAKRYRGEGSYLIGPDYYDNYLWVIKIALAGTGISALLSAVMQGFFHADSTVHFMVSFFTELFSTSINGAYCIIGIVTIIFAILEHQNIKVKLKPEKHWSVKEFTKNGTMKTWTPNLLPPVPDQRAVISRVDSVISIIVISLFSVLLAFTPQLFGVFHYESGKIINIACVFNLSKWHLILPILLLWLLIGMVDEIIRLVTGCYCKIVMYSSIICNTLEVLIAAVLLYAMPIWNPDFTEQLKKAAGIQRYSKGDILYYWNSSLISRIILAGICLAALIETSITIYKTLKYH